MRWCGRSTASTPATKTKGFHASVYLRRRRHWRLAGRAAALSGNEVSVVARGATLAALQSDGLRLEMGGQVHSAPVRASASPAELGIQELVIIAVKAPAMAQVARSIPELKLFVEGV